MGHPDKVADQISDALLDSLIAKDTDARTAIETLVTTGLVIVAGEVTVHNQAALEALSQAEETIRDAIRRIGYTDPETGFDYRSCAVMRTLHPQSPEISQGVTEGQGLHQEQGAGDQGLMFGFACDETEILMPLPIHLSHRLVERLAEVRERKQIPWVLPDGKSQVTIAYDEGVPVGIRTIVLAIQHTKEAVDSKTGMFSKAARERIRDEVVRPVVEAECPQFWSDDIEYRMNETGKFIIGGPHGDCGLTGRKIIVDTYGGRGRHGGGAFSGKDPTKVDRSAAYMARHVAKNIVAAGLAKQCEVQLAYVIGVADPVSVAVETFGTGEVSNSILERAIREIFPLKPAKIIEYLNLRRPIYFETARHGHFGRTGDGFTWEKTNRVKDLQRCAGVMEAA